MHTLPPSALDSKTKELHLWAAQGLAETCWATYVDQATGLGPDEVRMHNWGTGQEHKGRWMAVVEQWKEEGRPKGVPPGVRAVHREQAKEKWDYVAQKGGYLLRPEVCSVFVHWCGADSGGLCRPLRASTCCGGRRGTSGGASGGGVYFPGTFYSL